MTGQARRVLVVDDHDGIRTGIKSLLETRPHLHVVAEASDARTALKEAHRTKPDIAIVDLSLPELNGLKLTRALKCELPEVEVLIYTMHDREELLRDAIRAGAKGYVLKSDSGQHLLAAIDAMSIHRPYFSGEFAEFLLKHVVGASHPDRLALTNREREVVQLIAQGRINKDVAQQLNISVKTVETHRAAIMHKLKFHTTADLVRYAVRNNIIEV